MNPAPKVITGALHPDNRDACDWGFQGFVAYGCYGYIVIVDPNTLQVIQTLGQHRGNVCQVRWCREKYHHAFATGSTYCLQLAGADTTGTIIIWDVTNGQSRTEFGAAKDTKPVTCMEWYTGYDESHDLLAVLRFPDLLELWDGYSGVKLWRKVLGEPVQSMVFNPFDISSVVLLCEQSKILVISDFKPTSAPGDDYKVIQFVDSTTGKQGGSPSRRSSSSSLRHSRSWSKVISLAITIPSGLLGTGEANKKRQSVSSDDDSDDLTRCLQIVFNPAHRHQLFLLFEREILILDLDLDLNIGTIHLDKSSPSFVKIFLCRWTDVLYCLHDNGSISTRAKRRGSVETPSTDSLLDTNIDKRPVTLEMSYDVCCQSDSLRLLRNSKVYTSVYNPVTEKTVAILLSDSRLILWDVLTTELKNTHQCKDKPRYTLSDILEEPSPDLQVDRQRSKGKKPLRMIATGLIGGIISPITALCMLQSSTISDELEKLLALGSDAGVVQLVNTYTGQVEKEFKLFMSPVKGLDSIDSDKMLAFSYTDPGPYGNRAVKNDVIILYTDTGEVINFREKNERRGMIVNVKVSPSKLFAAVMYKEWPVELWNIPNKRLMHSVNMNFEFPTAVTWYPYYQKMFPKTEEQPVMTEQLFVGAIHEHGNLLRVNVIDSKMTEIIKLSLAEPMSSKSATGSEIVCMDWKQKLFVFADRTSQLFLSDASKKLSIKKIYERVGYKLKSVKFAPGKSNLKFLVVFDDRVDTWNINSETKEEMLGSSPKFSSAVLDGCWVGTDSMGVATTDGCLHIQTCTKRAIEKKLEDGFVYIPDTSMKRVKNPVTDWEVPEPVFSPALLEPKSAFLMKYILQCGLLGKEEEVQTHCQSESVVNQLALFDSDIFNYCINSEVSIPDRCLMVASQQFFSHVGVGLHGLNQYLAADKVSCSKTQQSNIASSKTPSSPAKEQAPGYLKKKSFSISEWFGHLSSAGSPVVENLLDIDSIDGQGQATNDLDISWIRNLDKVKPIESCFDVMMEETTYKAYQLSRLCLHNKKRVNYREKRECASRCIMMGVDDMAVQTLMETEADNEGFQNDCLRACLVSSLQSSSTSISTVKLAATQLIAAGKLTDGVELLCLIKKHLDACKYYMSFGMCQEAVWLAKISLSRNESLPIMYRWAELLWSTYQRNKAVLLMMSLGQYTTVLLMLTELKQYDKAALFLQTCLKHNLLENNSKTEIFIEHVFLEFAKLLAVARYKPAVEFYCDAAGPMGDNFRQDLKKMVPWS